MSFINRLLNIFPLTKSVFVATRNDVDAKFRMADDNDRDKLITDDLIDVGHIIYHEADGKHYKLKRYPVFGNLIGVVWDELVVSSSVPEPTSDGIWSRQKVGGTYTWVLTSNDSTGSDRIIKRLEVTGGFALDPQNQQNYNIDSEIVEEAVNNEYELTDLDHNTRISASPGIVIKVDGSKITNPLFNCLIERGGEIEFIHSSNYNELGELSNYGFLNNSIVIESGLTIELFKSIVGHIGFRSHYATGTPHTNADIINILAEAGVTTYHKPHFSSLYPISVPPNQTRDIIIKGSFFTPETTVKLGGAALSYDTDGEINEENVYDDIYKELVVNSITYIDSNTMTVNVSGILTEDTYDVVTIADDGVTEINNTYHLFLDNGEKTVIVDAFTVSSGTIYIPRAGFTNDIPVGDWVLSSGSVDVSIDGEVEAVGDSIQGRVVFDVEIPENKDFILEFSNHYSQYTTSTSSLSGAVAIIDSNTSAAMVSLDQRIGFCRIDGVNNMAGSWEEVISIRRVSGVLGLYDSSGNYHSTSGTNNSACRVVIKVSNIVTKNISLKILE